MISEPQRPGASEVCFAIGEKSAGNYNKLFSDENKCIKIEIGSSGRSDFQKGKPPGDRHPKFKERIS